MTMPSGRFVSLPPPYSARQAFIPDDLPPGVEYTPRLSALVARAEWALGGLASITDFIPNPELLVMPFQRTEAILSVRIEGTQTSADEVYRSEAISASPRDEAAEEVIAYIAALEQGLEHLRQPGSAWDLGMVWDLHRALLEKGRGRDLSPGRFREVTVWLGAGGRPIDYAAYVPPPWQEVEALMQRWGEYVRACLSGEVAVTAPPLLQCAAMHAQFEMIHPFRDGNGRLGRLLMNLMLIAGGHMSRPLLFLSAYFERYREEYYARLRAISEGGDWSGWFAFFLQGVVVQAQQAITGAKAILELRDSWRRRLQEEQVPAYLFTLLDRLFENPYTTIDRAKDQIGVSFPTAGKAIDQLQALGLVEEVTGRKRDRQFCATELLRRIEEISQAPEEGER